MASVSERGHAVNVANLLKYNQFLVGLGSTYNPQTPLIGLEAMEAFYEEARETLDLVNAAFETWKAATNQREILFSGISSFCVRLLGMLRSTDVSQLTLDDMAALVAKIRGSSGRAKRRKVVPAEGESTKGRSTSQLSFSQRIETFGQMVVLVKRVLSYDPVEPELAVAGLEMLEAQLVNVNHLATNAEVLLRAARMRRNEVLYGAETGLVERVKRSKAYVLAVYGKESRVYKNAVSYKFSKVLG